MLSTEERIAFLKAYADYAAAWFGDPELNTRIVKPGEAEVRLAQIKPQPLPSVGDCWWTENPRNAVGHGPVTRGSPS